MKKHIIALTLIFLALGGVLFWFLSRPDVARLDESQLVGREPVFAAPRKQLIPTVKIAEVVGWQANEAPVAAKGLTVQRFAAGLDHPRSAYVLPNGDVLVAETNSPPREQGGITGWIMKRLMDKAGAGTPSANRITLLRDGDGDGIAETRSVFLSGLNSPYGMALVGDTLYVANTDALLAYPYKTGDTKITAKPRMIMNLPAAGPNSHWTKNIVASPDGSKIYVAVGSNSNIAEGGLEQEANRAAILEVDLKKGSFIIFASGLRNPVGMAWEPNSGELWTVVNERDMLGSDLVPDYLTRVEFGAFYGWPWNYWGGYEDKRVEPGRPDLREYTKRPDYALGSHVAPLGLTFAGKAALGAPFTNGAFVGLHGSWNRVPVSGYKVVFVPFDASGAAQGKPLDVLTGFLTNDGKARGRPVDVAIDGNGQLLVTDDVGGMVWRVTSPAGEAGAVVMNVAER